MRWGQENIVERTTGPRGGLTSGAVCMRILGGESCSEAAGFLCPAGDKVCLITMNEERDHGFQSVGDKFGEGFWRVASFGVRSGESHPEI